MTPVIKLYDRCQCTHVHYATIRIRPRRNRSTVVKRHRTNIIPSPFHWAAETKGLRGWAAADCTVPRLKNRNVLTEFHASNAEFLAGQRCLALMVAALPRAPALGVRWLGRGTERAQFDSHCSRACRRRRRPASASRPTDAASKPEPGRSASSSASQPASQLAS